MSLENNHWKTQGLPNLMCDVARAWEAWGGRICPASFSISIRFKFKTSRKTSKT